MPSDTLIERTRRLPVELNEDELSKLHRRAKQLEEWIRCEREALTSEVNSREVQIDGMEEELKSLKLDIAGQRQWRDVTVSIKSDWEAHTRTVVRMDTGEVVDWRTLTPADLESHCRQGLADKQGDRG